jgi:crotonobetainyl-CoA:carnitine CoA-transferase CaiB-like acyl-CoA transferase
MSGEPHALPLADLLVLDLTQALAGPFFTQMLADFGARVIKVEALAGDFGRSIGPFEDGDLVRDYGGVFQNVNRNKESIAVDLKTADGREIILQLVREADVLAENFSADVMERLGLGYEVLKEINPRLIYTSIRGFGDRVGGESPYLSWPAFDIIAQAMGGLIGTTGRSPEDPMRTGGAVGDTVPSIFAALGTMIALWSRNATGRGQYVDIAMVDSVLAISEVAVNWYAHRGEVVVPSGNHLPGVAPFDLFDSADGRIALGAPHRAQWTKLTEIMGRPDLRDDPRYATDQDRSDHRVEVTAIVNDWTKRHTTDELAMILGGRVPFAPILHGDGIFTDPHFQVRDMLPSVERPDGRPVRVTGVVPKLEETPGSVRRRAPVIGENTRDLLNELGYDAELIDALIASKVVRQTSPAVGVTDASALHQVSG